MTQKDVTLKHVESSLVWIEEQKEALEQKRIDCAILRAKLLT